MWVEGGKGSEVSNNEEMGEKCLTIERVWYDYIYTQL